MEVVIVAGYGWSGSSAVIDLLKEYDRVSAPPAEFRLIRDPHGLVQLEHALVEDWEPINSFAAINDYIWLCKKLNRNQKNKLLPIGLSYKRKINKRFLDITLDYVNKLTMFKYSFYCYYTQFKQTYFSYLLNKVMRKIVSVFRLKGESALKANQVVFSQPSKEQFRSITMDYLEELFKETMEKNHSNLLILDQAVSPNNSDWALKYFRHAKVIVVDRDPRDIYADLITHKSLIGNDLTDPNNIDKYLAWHNALRKNLKISKDVLYVNFEDVVLNYEETKTKIESFSNLSCSEHSNKFSYFDPKKSIHNIGIWKNMDTVYQNNMKAISSLNKKQ